MDGAIKKSTTNLSHGITQGEVDSILIHPQDQSYYPDDYLRWRFDVSSVQTDAPTSITAPVGGASFEAASISKVAAADSNVSAQSATTKEDKHQKWTPFYRLNGRQKLAVETRLAPRINIVVWKKFPGSTVELKPGVSPPFV